MLDPKYVLNWIFQVQLSACVGSAVQLNTTLYVVTTARSTSVPVLWNTRIAEMIPIFQSLPTVS